MVIVWVAVTGPLQRFSAMVEMTYCPVIAQVYVAIAVP